tara:strand:+ start:432 stop:1658 length:1227 start_codon:yes stop_codon:yes gene_type:complete
MYKKLFKSKPWFAILITSLMVSIVFWVVSITALVMSLPSWKSHWFFETVMRLPNKNYKANDEPQMIYSSPDTWLYRLSDSSPFNYLSDRSIVQDSSASLHNIYLNELFNVANSAASAKERHKYFSNQLLDMKKALIEKGSKSLYSTIGEYIGYQPSIGPAHQVVTKNETILWLNGRFGAKFRTLTLQKSSPKGIVIALHGRGGSPEGVLGKVKDYTNSFGNFWHQAGYDVFAPDVNSRGIRINFPRLGLTDTGVDVALIYDLLDYIKDNYVSDLPIIIAGISYGSQLAEIIGVLNNNIDAVISIGGASRFSYIYSNTSLASSNTDRHYLNSFLDNGGIYDFILPKKLVISVGNHDAGGWGRLGENKIFVLNSFENRNISKKSKYRINLFQGQHEADPLEEIRLYEQIK